MSPSADCHSDDYSCMKRFWSFIKHRRIDESGVAPLKKGDNKYSHPKSKADILNDQFHTVFTRDEPAEYTTSVS